jgi:hypothetical protein
MTSEEKWILFPSKMEVEILSNSRFKIKMPMRHTDYIAPY